MAAPTSTVEIAWDSGYTTAAVDRTWTDVTEYVELPAINITRGRGDERSAVSPSTCRLTLDNTDGRFTPQNAAGAYYPNVKKGRPIRVRSGSPGNLLDAENASLETGIGGWIADGAVLPTLSDSSLLALFGTKGLRMVWPASAGTSRARLDVSGLTIGQTYTFSAWLRAASGAPDLRLEVSGIGISSAMTTKDAWTRASFTFVATGTSHILLIARVSGSSTSSGFADGIMLETGSEATEFTTTAPTTIDLFTGYVDEWPVEWPGGSDAMSTVTITATSRMARLGRSSEFKSIVEEEVLYDSPVLYYPLGEPEGATQGGNSAAGRSEPLATIQRGTGGTLTFGTGIGPGTDDLSAPTFTPASSTDGKHLLATLTSPVTQAGDKALAIDAWVTTTDVDQIVARLSVGDTYFPGSPPLNPSAGLGLTLEAGGIPRAVIHDGYGGSAFATAAGNITDGETRHLAALMEITDAGVARVKIMRDGVVEATSSDLTWIYMQSGAAFFPTYTHLSIGGSRTDLSSTAGRELFTGTISHVGVYRATAAFSSTRFAEHHTSGDTGFSGESSGARIERYARLTGIPTAEIDAETGLSTSVAHLDTTSMAPLEAMQAVEVTEAGVLFDARDGDLTFHGRDHRYDATSAFTLDCDAGDVEENLLPRLDDQGLVNDMTASREGGITVRATNDASIQEHGYYRDTVALLTTSDSEVQSRADWQVNRYGEPRVSVPNLRVDVTSSDQQTALLSADIGTRFTVTNLPAQAPDTTMDFFIEGITYDIGPESFTMEFNTSAAVNSSVWQLGVAGQSELGLTTVLAY